MKHKIYSDKNPTCSEIFGPAGFACTRKAFHLGPHQWVMGEKLHQKGVKSYEDDIYTEIKE